MALAFAIIHLHFKKILYCVSIPFFFFFFSFFHLVSINGTEWSTIPSCPSLMCSFNRGNIEGTNSLKICVWCLYLYVLCL